MLGQRRRGGFWARRSAPAPGHRATTRAEFFISIEAFYFPVPLALESELVGVDGDRSLREGLEALSCGTLWPMPSRVRCAYRGPVNLSR